MSKLQYPTATKQETEQVAKEFVDLFTPVVESRKQLAETEQELRNLLAQFSDKLDEVLTLKRDNLNLEKEVLEQLKNELNK